MGMWEWLTSATDTLKQKTPVVTPVTEVCRKSYDATRTATFHASRAVTTKARVVHECLSDDQVRGDVTRVAKNLSFNGALYFVRSYGGGPIIDIVSQSIQDRKTDSQMERLEELELKVAKLQWELQARETLGEISGRKGEFYKHYRCYSFNAGMNPKRDELLREYLMQHLIAKLEKELSARKMTEDSQIPPKAMTSKSQASAIPDERPESVLRNFVTQHFVGTRLFDNLVIPGPAKKENLVPRTDGNSE